METQQQFFVDQNTGIQYEIVPHTQSGQFDSLQTLVEVSSLIADQDENFHVTMVVEDEGSPPSQPRHTILAPRLTTTRPAILQDKEAPEPEPIQITDKLHVQDRQIIQLTEKPARKRGSGAAQVRPCHVCGELAGRHSYYGGECCPSCRAFFRRSVQSGYNTSYCCVKDGDCVVNQRTRKNCQYCRYQRCLNVGMKTTWVLSEEERKKKFEGRKLCRRKRKKSPDEEDEVDDVEPVSVDPHVISEEELEEVKGLIQLSGFHEPSKVNDMDTTLIRDIIRLVAFRVSLPKKGEQDLRDVLSKRFRRLAKRLKDFQVVSNADRDEILNQNIPVLVELQICTFFNPDFMWQEQLTTLIGSEEVDKLDRKLKSLKVENLVDLRIKYSNIFSHKNIPESFLDTVKDVGSWHQDPYEFVLLSNLLLFSPDSLQLDNYLQIQSTQNKFAVLLYKYLNRKHSAEPGVAVSRFAGAIQIVTKCKYLHSIRMQELKDESST